MAGQYMRLADSVTLKASATQPREQWLDLGAYRQIVVHFRILKAGTGAGGAKVRIQHAAIDEDGAFADLTGIERTVDASATSIVLDTEKFLRFIRWQTDAGVAGDPVVTIEIVAKE